MTYKFRKVSPEDSKSIIDIFNFYIENSFSAFPEKKVSYDFFNVFLELSHNMPFYIVENENKEVIGFGLLYPYDRIDAFSGAAQISYFILPEYTGKGIGTKLLDTLISDARKLGIHTLLTTISSLNVKSINFHLKNGFVICGYFKKVGIKKGNVFDIVWMQKFI